MAGVVRDVRGTRKAARLTCGRGPANSARAMPRVRAGALEVFYDTDGAGEPALLLMGLGGEHHAWDLVRPELARRHRLVLVDNRDAGASDEAPGPYSLDDMAVDALAVMDAVGVERFHVIGASMGGAIAQRVALQAPTRVASLVLLSTWGRTDAFLATILASWRLMAERLSPEALLRAQTPWAFTYRFFQNPAPEVRAWQAALAERGVLKSVPAYQRQVDACLAHDTLDLVPLLRTPSLVLVGEDDILTPPRYARALAAALPAGEVMLVPATGHACFLETPKPCTERILRFLTKHPLRPET